MGFFGSTISAEYGGMGNSSDEARSCLKLLASACGVTAFTQQQLHAGGNFVEKCKDEELKRELLPQFAQGKNICGVGFSHLRRSGPPVVTAVRTAKGFVINGTIPWISAWTLLDSFILGATVADTGGIIFCYLPIREFRNNLFASTPMRLSTMDASETVELSITDLPLPARYVLSEHPEGQMARNDFRGLAGHTEMPLGCALGSASFIRRLGIKRGKPHLTAAAHKIEEAAAAAEESALLWNGTRFEELGYHENALKARTDVIALAVHAAAAAIAALGGSAHLTTSPAQRRYREAAFYMTQAQTEDIQISLLENFIGS